MMPISLYLIQHSTDTRKKYKRKRIYFRIRYPAGVQHVIYLYVLIFAQKTHINRSFFVLKDNSNRVADSYFDLMSCLKKLIHVVWKPFL